MTNYRGSEQAELTPHRRKRILSLLADSKSQVEIAQALGVSKQKAGRWVRMIKGENAP